MCKRVSTIDEVQGLFRGYFGDNFDVVSLSSCELVLEIPLFPSKFSHLFASNVCFSVKPKFYFPENVRLVVNFYFANL